MIVGMLIKNYKIYGGLKYVPITTNHSFIAYIGDNGVGKSSILEALDAYFNSKEWNVHRGASLTDANTPYISIIHLLDKEKIKNLTQGDDDSYEQIEKISGLLWNFDSNMLSSSSTEAKQMIIDTQKLNQCDKDSHFLIISGIGYNHGDDAYFSSFDKSIAELFKFEYDSQKEDKNKDFRKKFQKLNNFIRNYYSYIYIPIENSIEQFTKLETDNMQKLMGKNINDEIEGIITKRNLTEINEKLNTFIMDLEKQLNVYEYKNPSNRKNITMNELTQKVIELFFSIRTLYKNINGKRVQAKELSSGEKRQALIDVAKALIESQDDTNSKDIVLAIDEPEASLNVSKIFSQFEKLINLSDKNVQVLITTHWYGFLPIATIGNAHFLTINNDGEKNKFDTFDLYNFRERLNQTSREDYLKLPDDIVLKSINDLVQSIVASIKLKQPYNWLICEGSSDKIYFSFFLSDLIEKNNLRILPVGGAKEVIRIYEYLKLPLREKNDISGKIYCLIDSDGHSIKCNNDSSIEKIVVAKRILNSDNKKETILVNVDNSNHALKTEIEDCLDGKNFIQTLKSFNDIEIDKILRDESNFSEFTNNSYFYFNLRGDDRQKIKNFFDKDNGYQKIAFANKYINSNMHTPKWIQEIKDFLSNSNKEIYE